MQAECRRWGEQAIRQAQLACCIATSSPLPPSHGAPVPSLHSLHACASPTARKGSGNGYVMDLSGALTSGNISRMSGSSQELKGRLSPTMRSHSSDWLS